MKKRRKKKKKNRKHCVSGPYIRDIRFPSVTGNNNMFIKILSFCTLYLKIKDIPGAKVFAVNRDIRSNLIHMNELLHQ